MRQIFFNMHKAISLCYTFQMAEHRLLIVEDSEPLRKVLAEKLRDEKFEVTEASGGEEGIKIATDQKPDMIITDIVMFPVDGLEMSRQIRSSGEWGKNVHIIALTNQNSAEEENRLAELKLTAYLVKAETSLDEVVSQVKAVLRKKK
jgi:DNA-binding response OmpR family regulator